MKYDDPRLNLLVFFDHESARYVRGVVEELGRTYPTLSVAEGEEINPNGMSLNPTRGQLDGEYLLNQLHGAHGAGLALWLVSGDVYHDGLNFVFGLAMDREALVSTYRLDAEELVAKEAVHEVGHLLGLAHCRYSCAMRFSNSLAEVMAKPRSLCAHCRQHIEG
jgi:archaemetzincin